MSKVGLIVVATWSYTYSVSISCFQHKFTRISRFVIPSRCRWGKCSWIFSSCLLLIYIKIHILTSGLVNYAAESAKKEYERVGLFH